MRLYRQTAEAGAKSIKEIKQRRVYIGKWLNEVSSRERESDGVSVKSVWTHFVCEQVCEVNKREMLSIVEFDFGRKIFFWVNIENMWEFLDKTLILNVI